MSTASRRERGAGMGTSSSSAASVRLGVMTEAPRQSERIAWTVRPSKAA